MTLPGHLLKTEASVVVVFSHRLENYSGDDLSFSLPQSLLKILAHTFAV